MNKTFCKTCKKETKGTSRHLQPHCLSCFKRRSKNINLIKYHGITLDTYEDMLIDQLGVCAICKQRNKNGKALAVDHCHTTGKIRALLCNGCNTGIGMFQENPESLLNAVEYLKKHKNFK